MRAVGKYKTVYEYDSQSKQPEGDGDCYIIKNRTNTMIKILDKKLCTKSKEQEIISVMNGETTWYGPMISDIAYSHGKFVGYVYESYIPTTPDIPNNELPESTDSDNFDSNSGQRKKTGEGSSLVRVLYSLAICIGLGLLTYLVFFDLYLDIVDNIASSRLADYFYNFNFYGVTGIIAGIVGLIFVHIKMSKMSETAFFIIVPVAYFISMALGFSLITVLIWLIALICSLVVKLLPIIIGIIVVVVIVKVFFGRRRKRF